MSRKNESGCLWVIAAAILFWALAFSLLPMFDANAAPRFGELGEALKWRRVAHVDSVSIEVRQTTQRELGEIMGKYGRASTSQAREWLAGFSVLLRNRETKQYRCIIWLLDLDDEETREHEQRHCNGWAH